jgi:hypothetical protein
MPFPLAERELNRSGRHWRTYALRVAATGAPCAALVFVTPISVVDAADPAAVGEAVSGVLLALSIFFQYIVAFFVAPMVCAGMIAQEKQERTLGLLLMADFRGWDVYAAKFVSAFLQCALLIASTLPLLAIAAILGGISLPAAAARFTLLLAVTVTVCALGLLASTLARKPSEALYITVFLVAAWLGGTWLVDGFTTRAGNATGSGLWASPIVEPSFNVAWAGWEEDQFLEAASNWLPGVIAALIISAVAMGLSLLLLPRQAYQKEGSKRRLIPRSVDRFIVRRVLQLRPATALIHALLSDQRSGPGSGLLRAMLPVSMLLLGLIPLVGWLFVFAVLCYDLSTSITHLRRNQAYDDLLVADLSVETIARSTWRALLAHSWPYFFGFVSGLSAILFPMAASNNTGLGVPGLMIVVSAAVAVAFGLYAFAVAVSCAVAVLRWGAVGQTLAGLFIFGWIQMFFMIGLFILAQALSSLADPRTINPGAAMILVFGIGMSACIYLGLTMLFRRGFENDFAYTLRNPDRMTLARSA